MIYGAVFAARMPAYTGVCSSYVQKQFSDHKENVVFERLICTEAEYFIK